MMTFPPRTPTWLTAAALTLAVGAPAAGALEHTVAAGETLTAIAARYCASVREVADRNGVDDPHLIVVGARLDVVDRCGAGRSGAGQSDAAVTAVTGASEREIATHLDLVPTLRAAADEFDVPADLLMALTFTESRWRSDRVSAAGAVGIGQILPETAAWLRALMGEPALDAADPTDNARMSARLLRFLLDRTDDRTRLALAAYFQGIGDVLRNGVDAGGDHYADVVIERRQWFAGL
jgi:hypothetical protein